MSQAKIVVVAVAIVVGVVILAGGALFLCQPINIQPTVQVDDHVPQRIEEPIEPVTLQVEEMPPEVQVAAIPSQPETHQEPKRKKIKKPQAPVARPSPEPSWQDLLEAFFLGQWLK
jgi:hypothetical protein